MHALPKAKVLMKQTMPGQGAAMNRARPNENIRTKEEPQEPPAKKAKTKIVFIEQKKKPLDIVSDTN